LGFKIHFDYLTEQMYSKKSIRCFSFDVFLTKKIPK